MTQPESNPQKPLTGIRVVDVGTFLAGPFCATMLAEFGAEVIKVELPGRGDPLRKFGSMTECGDGLVWLSESRNKSCVTLDLRKPEGADLLRRLVAVSDVICENFQPGTMEGWGLGYEDLKKHNKKLVMTRISAYGQTGPLHDQPGFGRIGNAFAGLSYLAGFPDRPPVTPGSATIADYLSGLFAAFGTMVALRGREVTGEGQVVDIGLYESVFRILDELAPAFGKFNTVRERMGPGTVNAVPHSHYPTSDGRWVAIACTTDKIFARLAEAMQVPEVANDGRYGTLKQREAQRAEVDQFVSDWTSSLPRDEVLSLCAAAQVPSGPVYSIAEIFEDIQYAARENIKKMDDPRAGEIHVPNVVPRLTATPGRIEHLGDAIGTSNQAVWGDLLGLSKAEMDRLTEGGVI